MTILGIDYGKKKTGVAIATSFLAEPLLVIRTKNSQVLIDKLYDLVKKYEVDLIVVGISENEMAKEISDFTNMLRKNVKCKIKLQDETLSTYEAQEKSLESGINRKKRRKMEDAFSAALILQSYLDANNYAIIK